MRKMIIGITCSEKTDLENPCQATNEDYILAIVRAGGVPVLLPICDEEAIDDQLNFLDGLLVAGGADVNPLMYHETCRFEQGESSMRQDLYEMSVIRKCANLRKPILGICRGLQMINVAFGGTLFQDNHYVSEYVQQHFQKEKKEYPIHIIRIQKESFLYPIFGDRAYVNSFHHQSIKKVADGFRVTARSEDSVIEAIDHDFKSIWAVQFHPEMMCLKDQNMQRIFNKFMKKCEDMTMK